MTNDSILSSVVNLINKHNTTTSTYDISNGQADRVKSVKGILRGGYKRPEPNINYPLIYVSLDTKEEEFATMALRGKKKVILNYTITPVINYGFGVTDGRNLCDLQLIKLTDKIETLIRAYPRLSITSVDFAGVSNTEYDVEEFNDTWNSISKITLNINMLV